MEEVTLLERMNKVPPKACRLLARKGPRRKQVPKTNADIAAAGPLARSTVNKLSHLDRWNGVTFEMADRFIRGTGVDPLAPSKKHRRLLARPDGGRKFLMNGTVSQRRMVDRILPKA